MGLQGPEATSAIEAARLTIPLLPSLGVAFTMFASLAGIIVWALTTFERRPDAKDKHRAHEERFAAIEPVFLKVRDDVSYIRGRLEPRD